MKLRRLKEIRLENNLTQEQVANILHIERRTYGAYENGKDTISLEKLISFVNYFNVSLDYMLDLDEKRNNCKVVNKDFDRILTGKRLRKTRRLFDLVQKEIVYDLNTAQSVWSRYEHGLTTINVPFLYAYACKIKISADYLVGRINQMKRIKPLIVEDKEEVKE